MAGDAFDTSFDEYEGLPIVTIASEEAFKAAVKTQNQWRENLDEGVGAKGRHGSYRETGGGDSSYRNSGEAINDVTVSPKEEGALEYVVGGDVVQLAVAEYGRSPSPGSPPPFSAIEDWAREKQIRPREGSFRSMIFAFMQAIAGRGIPGFAPGRLAAKQVAPDYRGSVEDRVEEEIEAQESGG